MWYIRVVSADCLIHALCHWRSPYVPRLTLLVKNWMDLWVDGWVLSADVSHTATTTMRHQGHLGVCDLWDVGKHLTQRIPTSADKDVSHNVARRALSWYLSEIKARIAPEWRRYLCSTHAKRQRVDLSGTDAAHSAETEALQNRVPALTQPAELSLHPWRRQLRFGGDRQQHQCRHTDWTDFYNCLLKANESKKNKYIIGHVMIKPDK